MQMIARVRVVVEVPFDYDVVLLNPDPNVDNDAAVAESRRAAADYAVATVGPATAALVQSAGNVIDTLVEEVREA
jgi:hypothetical protein